jgi:hypothetical protein
LGFDLLAPPPALRLVGGEMEGATAAPARRSRPAGLA